MEENGIEQPELTQAGTGSDPLHSRLAAIILEAQALGGPESFVEQLRSPFTQSRLEATLKLQEWNSGLPELLMADKRFPGSEARLVRGEAGASGFYPNFVWRGLISKALEAGDASVAISCLQKVLATRSAAGLSITAVWGAPIEKRIQLTPEVAIVPLGELPDSAQKQWLETIAFGLDSLYSPFTMTPPTSALVRHLLIDPFLSDGMKPDPRAEEASREYIETHELFQEIVGVLTLLGPRIALPFVHWFQYDDPDLQNASLMGGSRSQPLIEILPWFVEQYAPLDRNETPLLVQSYLALPAAVRKRLSTAIQRINQALRRRGTGDKAVELCTALEAILGDSGNSEMTHKVKVRATRLVGGDPPKRVLNAKLVGKTYDIRSTLVHTGAINEGKRETVCGRSLLPADIVKEALGIAVELVKCLVKRGTIPVWAEFDVLEHVADMGYGPGE